MSGIYKYSIQFHTTYHCTCSNINALPYIYHYYSFTLDCHELTAIQKQYYKAILERNFTFLTKGSNTVPNLLNTVMELRKCCNHPLLIAGISCTTLSSLSISLSLYPPFFLCNSLTLSFSFGFAFFFYPFIYSVIVCNVCVCTCKPHIH